MCPGGRQDEGGKFQRLLSVQSPESCRMGIGLYVINSFITRDPTLDYEMPGKKMARTAGNGQKLSPGPTPTGAK